MKEAYKCIDFYQIKIELIDVIQIGTSKLNGIPVVIGLWIFSLSGVVWDP